MNNQNIPNGMNTMNQNQQPVNSNMNNGYPQQPQANPYQPQPSMQGYSQMPQQTLQTANDPMTVVSSLNKEEAMEEALSHTNQYSPFQAPVTEIKTDTKQANSKKALVFIVIIALIMALFIIFLPQISKLFGWQNIR